MVEGGEGVEATVSSLVENLDTSKPSGVHVDAALMLARMGPDAVVAVPALAKVMLNDDYEPARVLAAWALWCIGEKAVEAMPALLQASTDPTWGVRVNVARAFGRICENDAEAIPVLAILLSDRVPGVRARAAWSLGEYGKKFEARREEILKALDSAGRDRNAQVKKSVSGARAAIRQANELRQTAVKSMARDASTPVRTLNQPARMSS